MSILASNTTKYVRIDPYGKKDNIDPDDIIDFNFPQNGVLDLKSLSMYFDVRLSSTSGASTHSMPRDGETIIQRLEVFVNGVCINDINHYQQIYRILSDFGYYDAENDLGRHVLRNGLLNGFPQAASSSTINGTYSARNWLGLLGEKELIDLRKNRIHIRMTISPREIIASANAANTFSLSNVYITCKMFENFKGDLKQTISYPDFKSILQFSTTTNQELFLKLFTKNVDYVVGTLFRTTNRTIGTSLTTSIQTTRFFEREGTPARVGSWNFYVNQRPLYQYAPLAVESLESMLNIMPHAHRMGMLQPNIGANAIVADSFAVGAKIGFINEEPQEMEISFTTTQGSTSVQCVPFMFAKIDNTIALN
jgi:hypothetical protein